MRDMRLITANTLYAALLQGYPARLLVCFHNIKLAVYHIVRCANITGAGAKPLQVPPPSSGKGVGGWGNKDLEYTVLNYSKSTTKSKSLY